jgi:parallel beta-helix repeat protein
MFISVDMGFEVAKRAEGATIYVPTDYPRIQEAIDAASDGDTIFVYPRSSLDPPMTYWGDLYINKNINLIGADKEKTIIEGTFSRYTLPCTIYISIFAEDVTISGFKIVNGGTGIGIDGDRANISGNIIANTGIGGSIIVNSDNNIISNNILEDGIIIYSGADGNTINGNTIQYRGISINYNSGNEIMGNTISNGGFIIFGSTINQWTSHIIDTSNTINGKSILYWKNVDGGSVPSGYGQVILANCNNLAIINQDLSNVRVGIELGFSSNINITSVKTINNEYGIYLSHSSNNNIIDCTITDNYIDGIHLRHSNNNHIIGNYISKNGHYPLPWEEVLVDDAGITLVGSSNNHIYHNDFIESH